MCYNIVDNTAKLAFTIFKHYVCNHEKIVDYNFCPMPLLTCIIRG